MSSISFSSRRNIWLNHHQHQLRKQTSLNEDNLTRTTTTTTKPQLKAFQNKNIKSNNNYNNSDRNLLLNKNSNLNNSRITSSEQRTRKFSILQKQISFDQIYNTARNYRYNNYQNRNYSVNNVNNRRCLIKNTNVSHWKSNDSISTTATATATTSDTKFSNNLTSIISKKNIIQSEKGYGDAKKEKCTNDRLKKSQKGNDDRVNLNIFLGNSLTAIDNDDLDSDVGSNSESVECLVKENLKSSEKKSEIVSQISTNQNSFRRSVPLQTNRILDKTVSSTSSSTSSSVLSTSNPITAQIVPNAATITAAPSLKIERRPPLIRTMSAPVRLLNENSKNILSNKRKPRRRKFLQRSTTIDKTSSSSSDENNHLINNHNLNENNENFNNKISSTTSSSKISTTTTNNNNNRKTFNKVKNSIGCDVVTLVSLISSEGSDSEKEEITHNQIKTEIENQIKRAPFLRKTGKSVSFQDDDIPALKNSTREQSHILRRGSLAPLAARLRSNRPPTAPPVPVFITEAENGIKMMNRKEPSSKSEEIISNSNINQVNNNDIKLSLSLSDDKEKKSILTTTNTNTDTIDNQFPEYIKSSKERECWKLFMKMSMKGISITYDTILRGMLTPTELRIIHKQQKEFEISKMQQQQQQQQNNENNLNFNKLKNDIEKENAIK